MVLFSFHLILLPHSLWADDPATLATWLEATDGGWSDAAKWSTAPAFPNNGSPGSEDSYAVIIDAIGAPYTVSLATDIVIDHLALAAEEAILRHDGGMLRVETIQLQGGAYQFGFDSDLSPMIEGATIIGNGGTLELGHGSSKKKTFRNVTLDVDVTVPPSGLSSRRPTLTVQNGLSIEAGRQVRIAPQSKLEIDGSQTLTGIGELTFLDPNDRAIGGGVELTEGTTLTLGPGITVRTDHSSGTLGTRPGLGATPAGIAIVNEGVISGQSDGKRLDIFGSVSQNVPVFENRGVVEAIGSGHTVVGGDWINLGVLRVRDNATLDLGGVFTVDDLGSIDRDGGALRIVGTLDNTGTTVTANASTGSIELAHGMTRGTIVGGTVAAADGATWRITGDGVLDGVQLAADLEIARGRLLVRNGIALRSAQIDLSSSSSLSDSASVEFDDFNQNQLPHTIDGQGRFVFTGGRNNGLSFAWLGTLTAGPEVVIETAGGDGGVRGGTFINQGTVRVAAGDSFGLNNFDLTNEGVFDIAGRMTISRDDTTLWRNKGIIRIRPGGSLTLRGRFRSDDVGTLIDEGAANVELAGTLDNRGRTLDLEDLNLTVPLLSNGGTILGGVLTTSGDATLTFVNDSSLLDRVTLDMDLEIPSSARVFVRNGLTLADHTLTLPEGAALTFETSAGPQLLGGDGVIFTPNRPNTFATTHIGGEQITIGEGITIRNGDEAFREVQIRFRENRGTIISEAPSTVVSIHGNHWTNQGLFRVDAGKLVLTGEYATRDIGTVQRHGGEVILGGNVDNTDQVLRLDATTGNWELNGELTGGRVETPGNVSSLLVSEATFDDVTVAGSVLVKGVTSGSGNHSLWLPNGLTLDDGIIRIESRAQLAINEDVMIGGQGEIVLDGLTDKTRIQTFTGAVVTVSADVLIRTGPTGGGTISRSNLPVINRGTISAETAGQILLVDGALTNTGLLQATHDSLLKIAAGDWENEGRLHVDGGTIQIASDNFSNTPSGIVSGSGVAKVDTPTFVNNGVLAPGTPTGMLRIEANYLLHATAGNLEIDIAGPGSVDFDLLVVTGAAELAGTLDVQLLDGFVPQLGAQFEILTAAELSGNFSNAIDMIQADNTAFRVTYGSQSVRLTVVPEPSSLALWLGCCGILATWRKRNRSRHRAVSGQIEG
jgi:hypothetical protein